MLTTRYLTHKTLRISYTVVDTIISTTNSQTYSLTPALSWTLISAPSSTNSRAVSTWPLRAAQCKGVC